MLPMTLAGANGRNKRKYAAELLDIVGPAERQNHHLPELSGGEQQRVAIAVSLANRPTLLLADEPTGEVDSSTAQVIYSTFQMLAHELGVTTVIVSHDPGIARHVERVVRIRDGMLATETRRQIRTQAAEAESNGDDANGEEEEEEYEELAVVDQAGRLHIPQEYLDELNFGQHAQLEITEEGILIRPATQMTNGSEAEGESAEVTEETGEDKPSGLRGLLGRFGRKKKADS